MNPTTDDGNGKSGPDRWCAECDGALEGEADVHDGELVCGPCGLARRWGEALQELDEEVADRTALEGELDDRREQYRTDLEELDRDFAADMVDLRRRLALVEGRIIGANRRLVALEARMAPPPAEVEVAPLVGGAPYEPTPEDLAEMAAHWAAEEARDADRRAENGRNPANGYE